MNPTNSRDEAIDPIDLLTGAPPPPTTTIGGVEEHAIDDIVADYSVLNPSPNGDASGYDGCDESEEEEDHLAFDLSGSSGDLTE